MRRPPGCSVNADDVPNAIPQEAKRIAGDVIDLVVSVDKHIVDFPQNLDGGWPGVNQVVDVVTYAQDGSGSFLGWRKALPR